MRKCIIGLALLGLCCGYDALGAQPRKKAQKPSRSAWAEKLDKGLDRRLSKFEVDGASVAEAIKRFGQLTELSVVLDPKTATALAETRISLKLGAMTARAVLGNILRMAGGLRYTYADGAIYVSTASRVAETLIAGSAGATTTSRPMTVSEAAVMEMNRSFYEEGYVGLGIMGEGAGYTPRWKAPHTDPHTGLTHFPGPPAFYGGHDDTGHRRFWFTKSRYYVKPEYRGLVPQSLGDVTRVQEVVKQEDDTGKRLLKIIAENPQLTGAEILQKLQSMK